MPNNKASCILIVDDISVNLKLLSIILEEQEYTVRTSSNGKHALESAETDPPDLILLDIKMPEMDGFEVCKRLKGDSNLAEIPVIFISAFDDTREKVRGFKVGGVDYITKPFKKEEVLARINTHIHIRKLQQELEKHNKNLLELVENKILEINESQMAMIIAMIKLTEARDDATGKHIERIRALCRILSKKIMSMEKYTKEVDNFFIENIYNASSLHDIGKVAIPDSILLKPAKLTPVEFEIMQTHALLGAQTLEAVKEQCTHNTYINMGIEIAKFHHEKWDGTGYPNGLKGLEIPLSARIMALADVYDALRTKRIYKESYSHEKSRNIIIESRGIHFEPIIVDTFLEAEKEFEGIPY